NGEPYEDLTIDINKYIMFRTAETIKVEHPDGTTEDIKLPEDIGTQLFEAGDIPAITPRYPFKLDSVVSRSTADIAGLKANDKIIAINEKPIEFYSDLTYQIKNNTGNALNFEVERDNNIENLNVIQGEEKTIGVVSSITDKDFIKFNKKEYGLAESITGGISAGYWEVKDNLAQFKYIFTKKGASQIGGFAAIGNMFPAEWNWQAFWYLTAFLSIMLGVINLLPIPALDGGHVM